MASTRYSEFQLSEYWQKLSRWKIKQVKQKIFGTRQVDFMYHHVPCIYFMLSWLAISDELRLRFSRFEIGDNRWDRSSSTYDVLPSALLFHIRSVTIHKSFQNMLAMIFKLKHLLTNTWSLLSLFVIFYISHLLSSTGRKIVI